MALSAVGQWCQDKTLIVVTHRPQVLQIVNRIIVMDGGKIVMDGPRDLVLQKLMQNEDETSHKSSQRATAEPKPKSMQANG